jgi:hypothetical protein
LSHQDRGDKKAFMKGKTIKKGSPKQKLGADIIQMLDNLKETETVILKVAVKITTGLIKVVFENSLMQKYCYYPTISI